MLGIPPDLARLYDTLLEQESIAVKYRPHYKKWLRYYWDFCHKYAFEPTDRQSFPAFDEKLRAKNQSGSQRKQAYHAVSLYYETVSSDGDTERPHPAALSTQTDVEDKGRASTGEVRELPSRTYTPPHRPLQQQQERTNVGLGHENMDRFVQSGAATSPEETRVFLSGCNRQASVGYRFMRGSIRPLKSGIIPPRLYRLIGVGHENFKRLLKAKTHSCCRWRRLRVF